MAPHLSIVIPAYNEEQRLPKTLARMLPYLKSSGISFEFVIVDDGSKDGTIAYLQTISQEHPEIRFLQNEVNSGRGASVKKGIFAARGDLVLETDSDGSVADEAIRRFVSYFDSNPDINAIFGSREMKGAVIEEEQPFLRIFLGYGFLFLARALFWMWSTTDFTLGFKMYRKDAAKDIFSHQFDPYYVAEAEKVFVAHIRHHHSVELPVRWKNDRDSRIRPFRDSLRSLVGVLKILIRHIRGEYS